jgi:hypothetical protein
MRKVSVVLFVAVAVVLSSSRASRAQAICLLMCPDFCTLSTSGKFCSCKCEQFPHDTIAIFKKAGIGLKMTKPGILTYSPTFPGDITNSGEAKAKGGLHIKGVPNSQAYVASPDPDARHGETADQTHARHEAEGREKALHAAEAIREMQRGGSEK